VARNTVGVSWAKLKSVAAGTLRSEAASKVQTCILGRANQWGRSPKSINRRLSVPAVAGRSARYWPKLHSTGADPDERSRPSEERRTENNFNRAALRLLYFGPNSWIVQASGATSAVILPMRGRLRSTINSMPPDHISNKSDDSTKCRVPARLNW
jgi:hypothetical protein